MIKKSKNFINKKITLIIAINSLKNFKTSFKKYSRNMIIKKENLQGVKTQEGIGRFHKLQDNLWKIKIIQSIIIMLKNFYTQKILRSNKLNLIK